MKILGLGGLTNACGRSRKRMRSVSLSPDFPEAPRARLQFHQIATRGQAGTHWGHRFREVLEALACVNLVCVLGSRSMEVNRTQMGVALSLFRGSAKFFLKGQIVNLLGRMCHYRIVYQMAT